LSDYWTELFADFTEFFGRSLFFFHIAMEMAVFALGIARMCDFEGNAKGSFCELIS